MKRQNAWIPTPDYEALVTLSHRKDLSIAELIRRAISDFVEKAKANGEMS